MTDFLKFLEKTSYPCRGILVGKNRVLSLIQI